MSRFVLVRGALGVGKTTVSIALARAIEGVRISIDTILERPGLEAWESGFVSEASFRRVNEIAIANARPVLRRGTPVVFDGNFYYRSPIAPLIEWLEFPHSALTRKTPLEECLVRDRGRSGCYAGDSVRDVFRKEASVEFGADVDALQPVDEILRRIRPQIVVPADPSEERSNGDRFLSITTRGGAPEASCERHDAPYAP